MRKRCVLCGKSRYGAQDADLCDACADHLPYRSIRSEKPPLYVDDFRAPFPYKGRVRACMLRLKFANAPDILPFFARFMIDDYAQVAQAWRVDCITYVPMSLDRWWVRGFNQSAELAKYIAKDAKLPCVRTLRRRFFSARQSAQKDSTAREENVTRNFFLHPKVALEGKRVLLIDDVCTTGHTISRCAQLLKQAGATHVFVICVAKVQE